MNIFCTKMDPSFPFFFGSFENNVCIFKMFIKPVFFVIVFFLLLKIYLDNFPECNKHFITSIPKTKVQKRKFNEIVSEYVEEYGCV